MPPPGSRRHRDHPWGVEGVDIDVFEHASIGMGVIDVAGYYRRVNPALSRMLRRPAEGILGHSVFDLTHPDDLAVTAAALEQLRAGQDLPPVTKRFLRGDGTVMWGLVTRDPLRAGGGELVGALRQVVDITDLKMSELRLEAAHRISRTGSWERDLRTGEVRWSDEVYRLLGYEPGEVEPSPQAMLARIAVDEREGLTRQLFQQLPTGRVTFGGTVALPDGTERYVLAVAEIDVDPMSGQPVRLLGTVQDVTEQEEGRRERMRLLSEIARSHEEERRRIGRELHDDLGQLLAAAAMSAKSIDVSAAPELVEPMARVAGLVDAAIDRVRSTARRLHPLDLDVGLEHAVRRMAEGMSGPVVVDVEVHLPVEPSLDVSTPAFRIVQEAVTNAVRHGAATRVTVRLVADQDTLVVEVADDGVGIPTVPPNQGGLGLRSMRERAESVGGLVRLDSGPGSGTTVTARLPLTGPGPRAS